ncbi:MAG: hypothetical protein K2X93_05035 [Candidatus Obscuribacterales bacterium]|nr:hypothetical protein [Candidatus Obscuribacterales bacterium]
MNNTIYSQTTRQGCTTGDNFDAFRRWNRTQPRTTPKAQPTQQYKQLEATPYYMKGIRPQALEARPLSPLRRASGYGNSEFLSTVISIPLVFGFVAWTEYPTTTTSFFVWMFSLVQATWMGLLLSAILFGGTWFALSINPTDRYCQR